MKFRISISQEQLDWILSHEDCPADLRKQLKLHLLKISEGLVKPAYEIRPPKPKTCNLTLPLEVRYKMALSYLDRGAPIPEELIAAYSEYRYLNDMMDEAEAAAYEQAELGI